MKCERLLLLVICACSKSSEPAQQPVPKPSETAPKPSETPVFAIKPVDKPHQPTPAELGPPVDVKTGYLALCAAVPPAGSASTNDDLQAYVRGALFAYPNPDVIRFWEALGDRSPSDRVTAFKQQLDAAGVTSCKLYDLLAARAH